MSTAFEAPLNFERQSPGGDSIVEQAAQTLAEKVTSLFRADGAVALTVQKLEQMVNERGPEWHRDDLEDLIYRAAKAGAEYGGGYQEAPREPREKDKGSWKERVLTICGTLVVIGIPSLILMYGQLSALKAVQDNQQNQLAHQQQQLDQLTQIVLSRRP